VLCLLSLLDLDDPFFHRVLASDASSHGLGITVTSIDSVSRRQARSLADRLPRPPSQPALAGPPEPVSVSPPMLAPSPSLRVLPSPLDHPSVWQTIVSVPWRRAGDHINVLELRAASTAVRWAISSPACTRTRILLLSDSAVSVFSLLKGRSSSSDLLPRLRVLSALLLACGVSLVPRWVPSHLNPADGPSRRC
jgi:hypothetical protein